MNLTKLKTKLKSSELTRSDVYELVNEHKNKNKEKRWRDSVSEELNELSDVLDSGVIKKVLNDLDSYDH